jgi:hypothetical protein
MARVSGEVKANSFDRLRAGEDVGTIADEIGVSFATVARWKEEANADPEGVAPPPRVAPSGRRRGKTKQAPISDETGKMLCAGVFSIVAVLSQEPTWFLDEAEGAALGKSFADAMVVLPAPMTEAINTYSAPAVFCTTLFVVVQKKSKMVMAKKAQPKVVGMPQRPNPNTSNRPAQSPMPPTQAQQPAPEFRDLADAVAAAKGSLADDEAPSFFESGGLI